MTIKYIRFFFGITCNYYLLKSANYFSPLQINIYANGNYVCGGTLMHKFWVLTHVDCAGKFDLDRDYVVARAGQGRYSLLSCESRH